jgi:hypothetical protein
MVRKFLSSGMIVIATMGCVSGPILDNPLPVPNGDPNCPCENPVLVAPGIPGPESYAMVFEKVVDVVDDAFVIASANRYDGRILTEPRVAPGYEQWWKVGSPNSRERLLASLQTYRHRCQVTIRAAEPGGYSVQVLIYKDLVDLDRPTGALAPPIFRDTTSIDRRFEVIDPVNKDSNEGGRWIFKGRDLAFEQDLLKKIRACKFNE